MTVPVLLNQHVSNAVDGIVRNVIQFVPRLVWTVVVLVVGLAVAYLAATRVEGAVRSSPRLADEVAPTAGLAARWILYFFAVTIALTELGLNTGVLVVFIDGIAFGLGVAVALLAGVAVGWGSKDYVAEHADEWFDAVTADGDAAGSDGDGVDAEDAPAAAADGAGEDD